MRLINEKYETKTGGSINFYEVANNKPVLVLIHAQGVNAMNYRNVMKKLSKKFHLFLVDCYGHGESSHNSEKYNLINIGEDLIEFIEKRIKVKVNILGHSSGGLIACYIASKSDVCNQLFLEDPPLFSCVGDRRYKTYNYKDLSTICHNFINQSDEKDFVYYYFMNQYCWNLFPSKTVEKIKPKLSKLVLKYRKKHPEKGLKIPFWPKKFMQAFDGLNKYDPLFGENFYNDSFNNGIDYEELLKNIKCPTMVMKAVTTWGPGNILQGAMSNDDLDKVLLFIEGSIAQFFDCGHGIHNEKPDEFIECLVNKYKNTEIKNS